MLYKQKDNKVVIVTDEVLRMPGYMKIYDRYYEKY